MKTLEQKFAKDVFDLVEKYGDKHPEESKERKQYGSMAHRLPILVHTAGLVQALAYVEDRNKESLNHLLDHLAEVLGYANRSRLLAASRAADFKSYQYLTRKTNIALSWFKRFAQSELKIDPGMEKD